MRSFSRNVIYGVPRVGGRLSWVVGHATDLFRRDLRVLPRAFHLLTGISKVCRLAFVVSTHDAQGGRLTAITVVRVHASLRARAMFMYKVRVYQYMGMIGLFEFRAVCDVDVRLGHRF